MSFVYLDQGSEMIIYESILTTFEKSAIFRGNWAASKIGLSLKSNHHRQI
jgi:hypothetical protein